MEQLVLVVSDLSVVEALPSHLVVVEMTAAVIDFEVFGLLGSSSEFPSVKSCH